MENKTNSQKSPLHSASNIAELDAMLAKLDHKPQLGELPVWYMYSFKSQKDFESRLSFIEVKVLQKLNHDNILEAIKLKLTDAFAV